MRIDLEELAKKEKWKWRHADYLLVDSCRSIVVVVEETSRAKIDDVEKLSITIEAIRQGRVRQLPSSSPSRVVAVIHAERRVDSMIYRLLVTRSRRGVVYRVASCKSGLEGVLREHGLRIDKECT